MLEYANHFHLWQFILVSMNLYFIVVCLGMSNCSLFSYHHLFLSSVNRLWALTHCDSYCYHNHNIVESTIIPCVGLRAVRQDMQVKQVDKV
jgi:hypothetical protein